MTTTEAVDVLRIAIEEKDVKIAEITSAYETEKQKVASLTATRGVLAEQEQEIVRLREQLAQQAVDHKVKLDVVEDALALYKATASSVTRKLIDIRVALVGRAFDSDEDIRVFVASLSARIEAGGLEHPDAVTEAVLFNNMRNCLLKARDIVKLRADRGWDYDKDLLHKIDAVLKESRAEEL